MKSIEVNEFEDRIIAYTTLIEKTPEYPHELEFRIWLNQEGHKYMSVQTYDRIKTTLLSIYGGFKEVKVDYENSIVFYDDSTRIRKEVYEDGTEKYIQKIPVHSHVDRSFPTHKSHSYLIRCSYNLERPVNPDDPRVQHFKVNQTRKRNRTSLILQYWKVDFTEIDTDNKKEYSIEIEYTPGKGSSKKRLNFLMGDLDDLFSHIHRILEIMAYYQTLTKKQGTFYGIMPANLEQKNIKEICKHYSITDKADGFRVQLLFLLDGKAVEIRRSGEYVETDIEKKEFAGTLIETEKIGKEYFCFDVIMYRGQNVEKFYLPKRLSIVHEIAKMVKELRTKKFYMGMDLFEEQYKEFENMIFVDNLFESAHRIWKERENIEYQLDGLIFTPILSSHSDSKIYKWKDRYTIDVEWANGKIYAKHGKDITDELPPWLNQISPKVKNHSIIEVEIVNENGELYLKFHSLRKDKIVANAYKTTIGELNLAKFPISLTSITSLVENKRNEETELKVDYDKVKKQTIHSRNKNHSIGVQRYNNQVKNTLIEKITKKEDIVMDLACGKGGDIRKYLGKVSMVVGIDSSIQSLNEYKKRLEEVKKENGLKNTEIVLIHADLSKPLVDQMKKDETRLLERVKETGTVCVCNFAIHYFLSDFKKWKSFQANLSFLMNKKVPNKMLFTYLNGTKIQNLLKQDEVYTFHSSTGPMFRLGRKYSYEVNEEALSNSKTNEIVRELSSPRIVEFYNYAWGTGFDEPLVYPQLLPKLLGFKKEYELDSKGFGQVIPVKDKMTLDEKKFIEIHHSTIIEI